MDSFWNEIRWMFFWESLEKEGFETVMKILEAHPEMIEEFEKDCDYELTDEEVEAGYRKILKQLGKNNTIE